MPELTSRRLAAALALGALAGCDRGERLAREALESDGYTDIELRPDGDEGFEFRAKRDDRALEGCRLRKTLPP